VYTTATTLRAVWEHSLVEGSLPDFIHLRSRLLACKELYTIYVAFILWGESWGGQELHIHTSAAHRVGILVHGRSRDLGVLHLARGIWLVTARQDIVVKPQDLAHAWDGSRDYDKWAIPDLAIKYVHDF
jgi:hypothetical protein